MWSYWKLYVSYARLGVTISPKVRNNLIGHFVFKTNIYDLRLRLTVRLSWTLWCVLLWLMFCGGCWMNEVVLLFILVCFTFVITGTLLLHFFLFCLMSFSHNLYYFWCFLLSWFCCLDTVFLVAAPPPMCGAEALNGLIARCFVCDWIVYAWMFWSIYNVTFVDVFGDFFVTLILPCWLLVWLSVSVLHYFLDWRVFCLEHSQSPFSLMTHVGVLSSVGALDTVFSPYQICHFDSHFACCVTLCFLVLGVGEYNALTFHPLIHTRSIFQCFCWRITCVDVFFIFCGVHVTEKNRDEIVVCCILAWLLWSVLRVSCPLCIHSSVLRFWPSTKYKFM